MILTGSASSFVAITMLGVFMVLLILMVYKMSIGALPTTEADEKNADQARQTKQLEECCTPDEKEKLLLDTGDCPEQAPPQQKPVVASPFLSDWSQLSVCLVLECVCFLMVFCFFVDWMFISRDVAFFSSNLTNRFHNRVNLTCDAPTMWTALDIMCFLGVCSWFLLGVWILGSFLLVNRWSHDAANKVHSRRALLLA